MKKATVAPMPRVQYETTEETSNGIDNNYEKPTKVKKIAKKKWNLLKNTLRLKTKMKKSYENINLAMLHERFKLSPHEAFQATQCLLEYEEQQEASAKREEYTKNARSSVANYQRSKLLISYFLELSKIENEDEKHIDYKQLETMFESGVDINVVDKHGQCVLHEVARIWHTDVAKFLLDHGSIINHPDDYGRTPLHVACAVDYAEMVEFLLQHGADINSRTYGEEQTPIHYAAKNDSSNALQILLKNGADMNDKDYKQRTPLQLAAELDRSATAEILVEEGAPAGVYDESMMAAIVLMIQKMPHVAYRALDQFYLTNRASRRQYFYLNYLSPPTEGNFAKSPLEVAVEYKQFQILLHPAFQRLIEVKWEKLGKWGTCLYFVSNLLLCLLWTFRLCTIPTDHTKIYQGKDGILGRFLEGLAVFSIVLLFFSEGREFFKAKRNNDRFKEWRQEQLERDLQFAHPRWPEERLYLEREIRGIEDSQSLYIRDKWNYFDWMTYCLMVFTVVTQVINVTEKTKWTDSFMRAVGSVTLIFLWLRMLKYVRPLKTLGPFVVMLSHVVVDTAKIAHLGMHLFIPYIAAFWVIFGMYDVEGYTWKNGEILYNTFQIMVVGDYNYENLSKHSEIMASMLCGTYIFFSGIICLNLFIALLSDTFQRVYDNAKANAVMQRAATIVSLEADIRTKSLRKHALWIANNCAPDSMYYDDDVTDNSNNDLKRMTHQVKEKLDSMNEFLEDRFGEFHSHTFREEHYGSKHNLRQENLTQNRENVPQHQSAESSREIRDLSKSMVHFQREYRKSMIQTRAEIAGLGLMLKELMEQNEKKSIKRQKSKKRKLMTAFSESMRGRNNKSFTPDENVNLQNDSIVGRAIPMTSDRSQQKGSQVTENVFFHLEPSTHIGSTSTTPVSNLTTTQTFPLQTQPFQTSLNQGDAFTTAINDGKNVQNHPGPTREHSHELPSSSTPGAHSLTTQNPSAQGQLHQTYYTNTPNNDDATSQKIPIQTEPHQSESFFEGYTFKERDQKDGDDHLIKSTWNSIFTQILANSKNQDEDGLENKQPKECSKEVVYIDNAVLSPIESSGDEHEDTHI